MAKSNPFKAKKLRELRTRLRSLDKKGGGVAWDRAKALTEIASHFSDNRKTAEFLEDPVDGLGYEKGTRIAAFRQIKALEMIPEKKVWERLGWTGGSGGISRIEKIPVAAERAKVISTVKTAIGRNGQGKLTQKGFREILVAHAPSLEVKDSWQRKNAKEAEIKKLRYEASVMRRSMKGIVKVRPEIRTMLDEEAIEVFDLKRRRRKVRRRS
jgi:hypothetical protein